MGAGISENKDKKVSIIILLHIAFYFLFMYSRTSYASLCKNGRYCKALSMLYPQRRKAPFFRTVIQSAP
jgi:hypothetical protein